ncbi:MAG TPA: hypothetical protein VN712_02700, partial [Dermatophilaceae bacterium]|nr:hypothetical protein [Dermatophilaceae bacterium]
MRFSLPRAVLGFTLVITAAACGGSVQENGSGSTGSGGTGGAQSSVAGTGGVTSTVATTTVATTGSTVASSSSTAASSTSSGPWMTEAPFPAPPQVQSYGGTVLSAPNIYGILFASDDPSTAASLADFTSKIGSTSYWTGAVSEYGVGPATAKIITVTDTPQANMQDSDVQSWLVSKFGTDPNFPPAPSPNDLYVIYYPAGVTINLFGMASCSTFGGYHDETSFNGQPVAYAVLPRCSYPGATDLEVATGSASHEMIEGATDPYPMSNPAYTLPDYADIFLVDALGGGEIGDMCAQNPQAFTIFPGFPYVVQRVWSNAQAAAGHDPCQPEPQGEVYYNAAPVFTSTVTYKVQGFQSVPGVRGIKIPVGKSATIPVDYYSDGPMSAWPAKAYDYQSTFMGGSPLLSLTLTPPTGNNGTKGTLQITVNKEGQGQQELFFIASSTDGGQTVNW